MRLAAYRITKRRHLFGAFSGEGARLYGGRWNSVGTRMVYVSSTLSLATLELLVHVEALATVQNLFCFVPIEFDERLVETAEKSTLPPNWNSPEPVSDTQIFGDDWVRSMRSAILAVPSAVIPTETNYLLNPAHPDFFRVDPGESQGFELDSRLKT